MVPLPDLDPPPRPLYRHVAELLEREAPQHREVVRRRRVPQLFVRRKCRPKKRVDEVPEVVL